ncbi:MAG: 16S rRNA (cytosine1402-N4)-methyltransferase [Gammaproteobacteria bacterium]|nr:MAG: 16S rRNA (cytosine1402-N4)-methyltransferase [Gammaproteobacteria bacterium]TND02695.1 MAG: 16S rRNA (cytosine1402-N4)-methyltransferase [Gammaproteobacteria bacterium]
MKALAIDAAGFYVDATYGRGGHAGRMLAALGPNGRLLAIDKDPEAVTAARRSHGDDPRFDIEQGSFASLENLITNRGMAAKVNGILLDLGVSSPQLDDPARGFSFRTNGPLDMRMDPAAGPGAADWIAVAAERDIAHILKVYGEERFARRIAGAIVRERATVPITTTGRLRDIIAAAIPTREHGKDPATRSFQAIRIYINRELDDLSACLPQALRMLAPGGRLAVISFHSLEDRIVKRFMRDQARGAQPPRGIPVTADQIRSPLKIIGKSLRPGAAEIAANPRARSAVLRVAERLQ